MKTTWKQYENNYEKYEIYGKYGKENTSNIYKYENYTNNILKIWKTYGNHIKHEQELWNDETQEIIEHMGFIGREVCVYMYI